MNAFRKVRSLLLFVTIACIITCDALVIADSETQLEGGGPRKILVFGGNGLLGSSTVDKLLAHGDDVTIVNRGNWYWDSKDRIKPRVHVVHCDRQQELEQCPQFMEYLKGLDKDQQFDAVIDFSAYGGHEVKETAKYLQEKVGLYILISTDSVYDVCEKKHSGPTKETDAVRPASKEEQDVLKRHHNYGHRKLEAEEELIKQRQEGGYPFVILRLPDVVGPRDTTYRWWIYQLWIRLEKELPEKPVLIPAFLKNYKMSLVYSEDVAGAILQLMVTGPQIKDQAINLAYVHSFTVEELLSDINEALGYAKKEFNYTDPESKANHFYLYPTVRIGPVDVTKAEHLLNWGPTPWKEAVTETVKFYEDAVKDESVENQLNEIVQIVSAQVYKGEEMKYYEALEKLYGIELGHFKNPKDEL